MRRSQTTLQHIDTTSSLDRVSLVAAGTTAKTLKLYEHICIVVTNAADACTITLPPVKEAEGGIYAVYFKTDGGVNVTVEDNNDDAGLTDVTLTAADDNLVVFSTGENWITLAETST